MQLKEAYLERAVGEVEDVAARVALLKTRFAQPKGQRQARALLGTRICPDLLYSVQAHYPGP